MLYFILMIVKGTKIVFILHRYPHLTVTIIFNFQSTLTLEFNEQQAKCAISSRHYHRLIVVKQIELKTWS